MKQPQPTNFKDDIMSDTMNGKRRYRMTENPDGTISLEDVTSYTQVGSTYGAAQVNAANTAINAAADAGKIIDDINALKAVTEEGYIAGAKAVADLVGQINSNITPQYTYQTLNLEFGADSTLTKTAYTSFPNKALGVSKQSHAWGGKTRYNISVTGNTITYSRDASTSNVSTCLSVTFIGY